VNPAVLPVPVWAPPESAPLAAQRNRLRLDRVGSTSFFGPSQPQRPGTQGTTCLGPGRERYSRTYGRSRAQAIPSRCCKGATSWGAPRRGTGKTPGFTLPRSCQRLARHANTSAPPARHPVRAPHSDPDRELAAQVERERPDLW